MDWVARPESSMGVVCLSSTPPRPSRTQDVPPCTRSEYRRDRPAGKPCALVGGYFENRLKQFCIAAPLNEAATGEHAGLDLLQDFTRHPTNLPQSFRVVHKARHGHGDVAVEEASHSHCKAS